MTCEREECIHNIQGCQILKAKCQTVCPFYKCRTMKKTCGSCKFYGIDHWCEVEEKRVPFPKLCACTRYKPI